ncbi:MAG TPA: 3-deoxy-7-phosphoheptulonate synthase [Polyangiaceae bacterium]|nr:3-deoxy-7-phosphoheptulonate synthase [Polyangiaceae bacterium]
MHQTNNLHVLETTVMSSPDELKAAVPITEAISNVVHDAREAIRDILWGRDSRVLAIVGPCSIHDPDAAIDYAARLAKLRDRISDDVLVVMRVYFEKPRTTIGWKGLINDPHLDGTYDIPLGLRLARRILAEVGALRLPTATEMLDPIVPQYIADLVSWAAIGARTTESQTHREMSSGLSMPVGFKNATDGGIEVAVNAIISAARSHRFLGVDGLGRVSVVRTAGNPDCHLVLRGGAGGPNYDAVAVARATEQLRALGANPRMIVDCSHDNSGKNHDRQPDVAAEVATQIRAGQDNIVGVMIESNIVAGKQSATKQKGELTYGQSITDGCVDLATTEQMLIELADAANKRKRRAA